MGGGDGRGGLLGGSSGLAGAAITIRLGSNGTTANTVFNNLRTIPGLVGNIDVFGPNGGPFTVVFFNNLAKTDVPQMVSSQADSTATLSQGKFVNPAGSISSQSFTIAVTNVNPTTPVDTDGGINRVPEGAARVSRWRSLPRRRA